MSLEITNEPCTCDGAVAKARGLFVVRVLSQPDKHGMIHACPQNNQGFSTRSQVTCN